MFEVFDGFLLVISLPKLNSMLATCVISDMYVSLSTRGSYAVWLLPYLKHLIISQIDTKYSQGKRINLLLKRNIWIDQMIREQAGITRLQASYHTLPTTDVCMYFAMMSIMSTMSKTLQDSPSIYWHSRTSTFVTLLSWYAAFQARAVKRKAHLF